MIRIDQEKNQKEIADIFAENVTCNKCPIKSYCDSVYSANERFDAYDNECDDILMAWMNTKVGSDRYSAWKEKYSRALEHMAACKGQNGVLIEIAAQHPLKNGDEPNEEFAQRLILGAELYQKYKALGQEVKIYVPGSIHMDNGAADKVSLSQAGNNFLMEHGVPKEDLFGDDANLKYKGEKGVYSSPDECYVASCLFREMKFGELHCVCSSAQMFRKMLSYISFGYAPYMHTVTVENMHHNYIDEIFKCIPAILDDDDAMQGDSEEAEKMRASRNPNYKKQM